MADEAAWIKQQRKAFMGWCNGHLADRALALLNFEEGFQDGILLWNLIEIISNKPVKFESKNPKSKIQKVNNINHVFKFLEGEKLKLVNIGPEDIFNGNSKLILGFVWTLILRYHVQKGQDGNASKAKQELLEWVNKALKASGSDVQVENFKGSFSDGRAFCGLVNYLQRNSIEPTGDAINDMKHAFDLAQDKFHIPSLLDAELVHHEPDDLSIMTYVSYFRGKKPDVDGTLKETSKATVSGSGVSPSADWDGSSDLTFDALAFDFNNEQVPVEKIEVHVDGPSGAKPKVEINKSEDKLTAHAAYKPTGLGEYKVAVKVNGREAEGNPFHVHVKEGVDHSNVKVSGRGSKKAVAGKPAHFKVKTHTKKGKRVDVDAARIGVEVDAEGNKLPSDIAHAAEGTYQVTYTPEKPGDLSVNVNFDNQAVKDSPFHVAVSENDDSFAAAENTTASGVGLKAAQVNKPAHFKIFAKTANGEKAVGEAFDVDVATPTGDFLPVDVTDNGDGSYTVTYTPTQFGDHKVSVQLDNQDIRGTPATVAVTEGPVAFGEPDANNTKVYGPGIEHPYAGVPTSFTVAPVDANGNPVEFPTDVEVSIKGPDGSVVPAEVKANDNGTSNVHYKPELGDHEIEVSVNGEKLAKSPFKVTARVPFDASNSTAAGAGLENPMEDRPTEFKVQLKDGNGDNLTSGGYKVEPVFHGPESPKAEVVDNGDGTYDVKYTPNKPGDYKVDVLVDGTPIGNSPYPVDVQCSADPSKCTAHGPGLEGATQFEPATFTVQAKDKNGNNLSTGLNDFDVTLKGPNGEETKADVKDNGDGTYTVSYEPTGHGDHEVTVKLDDTNISGSPFTVPIAAPNADPAHSFAKGPGLKKAYNTKKNKFNVSLKDKHGKALDNDNTTVEVKVEGPEGEIEAQVHKKKKGEFEVKYQPTQPGDIHVHVSVNGQAVKDSPFTVKCNEGPDKTKTKVSGKGLSAAFTNRPANFTVEAFDKNGEPIDDEDLFEVELVALDSEGKAVEQAVEQPAETTEADVDAAKPNPYNIEKEPASKGKHPVYYQLANAGRYQLSLKHGDDDQLGESPYTVTCKNGAKPDKSTASKFSFTITAKNDDGEIIDDDEDTFEVEIEGPQETIAKVKPLGKGKYFVSYVPKVEGVYKIHVKLGGISIKGSPFTNSF